MYPFLKAGKTSVVNALSLPCPRPRFEAEVSLQMHTFNRLPDTVDPNFQKFPEDTTSFQKIPEFSAHLSRSRRKATGRRAR